ncbi:MAG: TldD/PmbA family protein [Acidobacteria bacterium]|nr:TldD/PmbA family protein [Acidobacteriota bacterium]
MADRLLTLQRCQELFAELLKHSQADETELLIGGGTHSLTRFANNTIHQNVAEEGYALSVRTSFGQRTARATTNRFDAESLKRVVAEATSLARQQQPDAELLPMPGPQQYEPVNRYFEETANATADQRAHGAVAAIHIAESSGQVAAGTLSTGEGMHALLNSRGLAAYYRGSHAEFSFTATAPTSTGWAKKTVPEFREINAEALAAEACRIAARSAEPREIPPERYVTILSPAAVLDLLGFLFYDFSGQALRDQRSFLTGRVGEKLFGENISITDDVYHPLQSGAPFDGEGLPRQRLRLVERGVIKELAYSRQSAKVAGVTPTGHGFPLPNEAGEFPSNIVIAGGTSSIDKMVASTERGILVTRLWYIREVDPYKKILTGMTRDGTFLVENGKVQYGIRNFRFNESLVDMLNAVEMMAKPERSSGEESFPMVVPAMKVSSFHFTEATKF